MPDSREWQNTISWYKHRLKQSIGWCDDQWVRFVQITAWENFLRNMPISNLDALEISPGGVTRWRRLGFRSYTSVEFPEFDITRDILPEHFDVIIAEHVFEHLRHPYAAARHVKLMLKKEGVFLIATPFLVRVHGVPSDYLRWTPDGLMGFLEDCGFEAEIHAWGNRSAVRANFRRWKEFGYGRSLRNEPEFPVVVWGYARAKG
jgi:SAM-dependent methyltransferase